MAYTYIIDKLKLDHKGLRVKDETGKWVPLHHKQGELDGACGVYSCLMALLSLGYIDYADIKVDVESKRISRKTNKGKMLSKLIEQQGLLREGYLTSTLAKDIRYFCSDLDVHYHKKEEIAINEIQEFLMNDMPVVIGITAPRMDHFILAVGLEYEETVENEQTCWEMKKILCLDPGSELDISTYWNCIIDVEKRNKGYYPFWYITKGVISKSKIDDIITIKKMAND